MTRMVVYSVQSDCKNSESTACELSHEQNFSFAVVTDAIIFNHY